MYVTEQRLNDIYRNCNEIMDYLDKVNTTKNKDEKSYAIHCVSLCIDNIRDLTEYIGIGVAEKEDKIHVLQEIIKQLELDFEDLD